MTTVRLDDLPRTSKEYQKRIERTCFNITMFAMMMHESESTEQIDGRVDGDADSGFEHDDDLDDMDDLDESDAEDRIESDIDDEGEDWKLQPPRECEFTTEQGSLFDELYEVYTSRKAPGKPYPLRYILAYDFTYKTRGTTFDWHMDVKRGRFIWESHEALTKIEGDVVEYGRFCHEYKMASWPALAWQTMATSPSQRDFPRSVFATVDHKPG